MLMFPYTAERKFFWFNLYSYKTCLLIKVREYEIVKEEKEVIARDISPVAMFGCDQA